MRLRRIISLACVGALAVGALTTVPSEAAPSLEQGCVTSVPDLGASEPVDICYTLYRPESASAENPVPVIFHSHGWGGSRTNSPTAFRSWLDAGFGVISFDQRGFGQSGGQAHVEHPEVEGRDVQALVDLVATKDWVAKDADDPTDPVLGAIGGSYGGGYQMVGAFSEILHRGETRFDALAPEITWYDLQESLAPQEISRTAWVTLLYAAGAGAHTETVHKGFAYGAATGLWPTGPAAEAAGADLSAFFEKNGPKWHVDNGRKLDIPVLIGQGTNDNLFNLNQGLQIFDKALTAEAKAQSIFVGYNGGHALPNVLPPGVAGSGDPCTRALGSNSFSDLSLRFFRQALKGESTGLGGFGQYHISDTAGKCLTVDSQETDSDVELGTLASTTALGGPVAWKIADGPISLAGTPFLDADVTSLAADGRAFLSLSMGTSPADARVISNNMLPIRELLPVVQGKRRIELPAIGVTVPAGQSLFLTISPVSDMSFGHGSRTPGAMVFENAVIRLPVV